MKKSILLSITLLVAGVDSAFAYIDPGSGSAIMSGIIGFFVAIGVLVKTFWFKIKGFLGLSKSKKNDSIKHSDLQDKGDKDEERK